MASNALGAPLVAIHAGTDNEIDLVDQPRPQKRAIGGATAFDQQPLHAEIAVEDIQRQGEVELRFPGENIVHAFTAQPCQVRIRNRLRQDRNNRIAADVGTAPADLSVSVEYDAIRLGFAAR